jgi:hypothetical protein
MREPGCVACTEGVQKIFWWEILKAEHLGKLSLDRSLMLKRIIRHSLPSYGLQPCRDPVDGACKYKKKKVRIEARISLMLQ